MLMSKYSSLPGALLAALLLASCQSVPQPEPKPETQQQQAGLEPAAQADSAEQATEQVETEPVDVYQQHYQQALQQLKSGNTEQALVLLQRLSRNAPEKPYLFTNLGLAYFGSEQPEQAEQAFMQAISSNPNDAVAHNPLGILKRRKGQFDEALVHYQRAIAIDSGYAGAHLNLGILFDLYLQDLEKALQQYRQYRSLSAEENAQVDGWILDIERRLGSAQKQS
jgi:Flp pilus assembly protein TadD